MDSIELYNKLSDDDQKIYRETMFLRNDDETLGCFIKGHLETNQWRRVAIAFLKDELNWAPVPRDRQCVKKGYYKVVPRGDMLIYHFSEEKMKGSFPVMEMQYL